MTVEDSKAPKPQVQRVLGIVRRGSEILLVRESLGADGEILWSLPGGGVEDGELMHEALRRELKEETGPLVGNPVRTARAAIGKGAAAQPGRHRQQRPDRRPLRVCHARRIPPNTFRVIDCDSEPVGDTITRWSSRVELHRRKHLEAATGSPGSRLASQPRATKRPCLYARGQRRSPDRDSRSTHTPQDRNDNGF
ncbi:NUDIX domain-containing protein [Streptomyces sp. NPDC056453]|uniref:NUDIX domain-containing protein n=1 Tax=Streptomyces sp. NPDC056453 TaxID=3345822 RepID=UPI00369CA204